MFCRIPSDLQCETIYVEFQIISLLPNHLHAIVMLNELGENANGQDPGSSSQICNATSTRFGKPVPGSLATIVRSVKSAAARHISRLVGTPGGKVWQRGYYDRIIRDEDELDKIRRYVVDNPWRWESDRENLEQLFRRMRQNR